MKYRRFGRTGLEVSELAFGGGRSGGILIDADDETRRLAIRHALDLGINWFDTAPQYGQGKSEQALGWLLKEVDETPYLSTKVKINTDEGDDIAGQVERSITESLKRLGRDQVDLLQLHSPVRAQSGGGALSVHDVLRPGGAADGLERAREEGLTRFIGLTGLGDARGTREIIESGRFDAAQIYYNMLNPSAAQPMPSAWQGADLTGLIQSCRENDMAVMAIRIFAASYLATPLRTGRESILTANTNPEAEERMAEVLFDSLGDAHGSRAQTAVRHVLSNPDISTAIVGLSDPAYIEEAAAGANMGPLPDSAFTTLEDLYKSDFGKIASLF
jgi:L-glyceraldehyde 3-phosphate reductase